MTSWTSWLRLLRFPLRFITFEKKRLRFVTFQKLRFYVSRGTPAILQPLFKDLSSDRFGERTPIPEVEPRS